MLTSLAPVPSGQEGGGGQLRSLSCKRYIIKKSEEEEVVDSCKYGSRR